MTDGKSLNLMDHCLRAVGFLQDAFSKQPHFLDIIENTTIGEIPEPLDKKICCYGPDGEPMMMTCLNESDEPEDPNILYNVKSNSSLLFIIASAAKAINNTPATLVSFTEQNISCENPFDDTGNGNEKHVHELTNWRSFGGNTEYTGESACAQVELNFAEAKKREKWYWALKMRLGAWSIIPAILKSAQEMRYKFWILPNGVKVPLNQVKLMELEVIPNHVVLFQRVIKSEQAKCTNIMPFRFKKIPKSLGMSQWHAVIEATLSTGEKYVVDPTSMQYNYQGSKGSLIAHGTWDQYVKGFPGTVFRVEKRSGDICFGKQVKSSGMIIAREFCAYCGLVEGKYNLTPHSNCRFETLTLKCGRCKLVAYCNQFCQKAHWKQHKPNCA